MAKNTGRRGVRTENPAHPIEKVFRTSWTTQQDEDSNPIARAERKEDRDEDAEDDLSGGCCCDVVLSLVDDIACFE